MTDETQQTEANDSNSGASNAPLEKAVTDDSIGKTFPIEYVQELRNEAAARRKQLKEVETELAAYKARQQEKENKELAESNKWQELAEKHKRELEDVKAQLEITRLDAVKLAIGQEYGLPTELIARLKGNTDSELRADAETLASIMPNPRQGQTTTQAPYGKAQAESDEQKRQRLFHSKIDVFGRHA